MISSGFSPESVSETLSDSQRHLESLELALRTRYGVPVAALAGALEAEPELAGLVTVDATRDRTALTLAGRLLANEVACRLSVPNALKVTEMAPKATRTGVGGIVSLPWPSRLPG
jgi:hypothetical protein